MICASYNQRLMYSAQRICGYPCSLDYFANCMRTLPDTRISPFAEIHGATNVHSSVYIHERHTQKSHVASPSVISKEFTITKSLETAISFDTI